MPTFVVTGQIQSREFGAVAKDAEMHVTAATPERARELAVQTYRKRRAIFRITEVREHAPDSA